MWDTQPGARVAETPYGTVRVHDNPWPASPLGHRLLVPTEEHLVQPAALTEAHWSALLSVTRSVVEPHLWPFLAANLGGASGASVPHLHAQLLTLTGPVPAAEREHARLSDGPCPLCRPPATLRTAFTGAGMRVLVPAHGGEILLAPDSHLPRAGGHARGGGDIEQTGALLAAVWAALAATGVREGQMAVHEGRPGFHWHVHVTPMTNPAGCLERLGGLSISRHSADRLLDALQHLAT